MMRITLLVLCALVLLVGVSACTSTPAAQPVTSTTAPAASVQLTDLQVTACNSADAGQTCVSKLPDLGIVTKEQCCQALKKCC